MTDLCKTPEDLVWIHGLQKERKKRFSHKTRSGCITCKKRRVKCDETRPICVNCEKGGRQCEGYESARLTVRLHTPRDECMKSCSNPLAGSSARLRVRFGENDDERYLASYFRLTAKELAKFSDPYVWLTLVPQVSAAHKSVRQALTAVTLACDESCKPNLKGLVGSKALRFYNDSIQGLMRTKGTSKQTEVVLICCVLFWLFENIKNRPSVAMMHLRAAVNMLKERVPLPMYREDIVSTYIEPLLRESMSFASMTLPANPTSTYTNRPAFVTANAYRNALEELGPMRLSKDIHDARLELGKCCEALLMAKKMMRDPSFMDPDLERLQEMYEQWKQSLDMSWQLWPPQQQEYVRLLSLHYEMQKLDIEILQHEIYGIDPRANPDWSPNLWWLLDEARYFAKMEQEKGDNIVSMSVITVLSSIARQASKGDEDIAEEAIATLEKFEFFENIWSSRVAGEMMRLLKVVDRDGPHRRDGDLEDVLNNAAVMKITD